MMRPVLISDLICAGRALLNTRPAARKSVAKALFRKAQTAQRYCERTGHRHPYFGNGTLGEAARHHGMAAEPLVSDIAYAEALMCVLEVLIEAHSANDHHSQ
jgi:hypothetical protein